MATILALAKLDVKPENAAGPPRGPSHLRMMPMQRRVPKARLPPATRNAGSGTEVESCTRKKKVKGRGRRGGRGAEERRGKKKNKPLSRCCQNLKRTSPLEEETALPGKLVSVLAKANSRRSPPAQSDRPQDATTWQEIHLQLRASECLRPATDSHSLSEQLF